MIDLSVWSDKDKQKLLEVLGKVGQTVDGKGFTLDVDANYGEVSDDPLWSSSRVKIAVYAINRGPEGEPLRDYRGTLVIDAAHNFLWYAADMNTNENAPKSL